MQGSVDQLVGKMFGEYELRQVLGQGNLSAVYEAWQSAPDRAVMLTVFLLPPACVGRARERFMDRFLREAEALTRLSHPHVVPVYDFGQQTGYPFLVTPLSEGGSLATLFQQQPRYTPAQTLGLLRPIAAGLDYAHKNGVVHGALKPSNILLTRQALQIAGFGLAQILAMEGIGHIEHAYPHLFSIAGTLLANPLYVAPEVVKGAPADARSDVYSLGVILFEMLTGQVPFRGSDPLEIALQHVEQPVPPLQSLAPEVPIGIDIVLQRALERDPARRASSAGNLLGAFERTLKLIEAIPNPPPVVQKQAGGQAVVGWLGEPDSTSARIPAMKSVSGASANVVPAALAETGKWKSEPPLFTGQLPSVDANPTRRLPQPAPQAADKSGSPWWTTDGPADDGEQLPQTNEPGQMVGAEVPAQPERRASRRTVLIASGAIAAAAIVGVGGFSLMHLLQAKSQPHTTTAARQTTGTKKATPPAAHATPTHAAKALATSKMPVNTAITFTNPADRQDSVLVRLPNGDFVAYERACTHQGVLVDYHPENHELICPLHHSIYDPANNAKVLGGPAPAPLKKVAIKVNGDGTVTLA